MSFKVKSILKKVAAIAMPALLLSMYSVPCFAAATDFIAKSPMSSFTAGSDKDLAIGTIDGDGTDTIKASIYKEDGTTLISANLDLNVATEAVDTRYEVSIPNDEIRALDAGSYEVKFTVGTERTVDFTVTAAANPDVITSLTSVDDTNFTLSIANGTFADDSKLSVSELSDSVKATVPSNALVAKNVKLVDASDKEIDLSTLTGTKTLSIKVGTEYAGQKVKVFTYDLTNTINWNDAVEYTVDKNGNVNFEVSSLTFYYVTLSENKAAEETETAETTETTETTSNPSKSTTTFVKTGDASFALQGLAAMISTGLGLFVMKKRNFNK